MTSESRLAGSGSRASAAAVYALCQIKLDTENSHDDAMNHFSCIYKVQTPGGDAPILARLIRESALMIFLVIYLP